MPCFHPKPATKTWWRAGPNNYKAKLRLGVKTEDATHWIGCGKCIGCREQQAMTWTVRLKHESRLHWHNTFLTLTYDDEKGLPNLSIPDMQKFWKRLRKALPETPFKHFYCGEYGDRTHRAHYHAAVFGFQPFPDSKKWDTENTVSERLNEIWTHGRVTQSELTPYRMAYVAGYVLKKAGYRKQIYCDEDGVDMQPPFRRMSNGLGKDWLEKYGDDLRLGYVSHEDFKVAIPRYYIDKINKEHPALAEMIQKARETAREKMSAPDRERLKAGEEIRHQQIKRRKRDKV